MVDRAVCSAVFCFLFFSSFFFCTTGKNIEMAGNLVLPDLPVSSDEDEDDDNQVRVLLHTLVAVVFSFRFPSL